MAVLGVLSGLVVKAILLVGDAYNTGDALVRGIGEVITKACGIGA